MPDARARAPFPHQSSSANLKFQRDSHQSQPSSSWSNAVPSSSKSSGGPLAQVARQAKKAVMGFGRRGSSDRLSEGIYEAMEGGDEGPLHRAGEASRDHLDTTYLREKVLSMPSRLLSSSPISASRRPFQIPVLPSLATVRFVLLCSLWYFSSALSSNTGKVILNNFKFPVTLTIIQFFFVAFYCWVVSRRQLGWTGRLREPTQAIVRNTLPMACFQVGGHIFSSMAISRVPVSTVHTIKALSPLFTVAAYAVMFRVSYSPATYISLLPLTFGVMLACSSDLSLSNLWGLICAFGSTLVFVSSNIVFKKLMPQQSAGTSSAGPNAKLDKINLLFFSSGMAFILMIPIWLFSDFPALLALWLRPSTVPIYGAGIPHAASPSVTLYMFLNGTVHFGQNFLAFAILSTVSPVTYSIASLVKRIAVICLAIVWFKQAVHPIQALGIALTGVGLWMYNNAKRDVERGEKRLRQLEAAKSGMLPISLEDQKFLDSREGSPVPFETVKASPMPDYSHFEKSQSVSSAFKANGYPAPPKRIQSDTKPITIPLQTKTNEPYPSPPASTSSSPPNQPAIILPAQVPQPTRNRKNSVVAGGAQTPPHFIPGPPIAEVPKARV